MQEERLNNNIIRKEVIESKLDYLFELYTKGVPLSNENLILLQEKGYFKKEVVGEEKSKEVVDKINQISLNHSTGRQKEVDKNIDVLLSNDIPDFINIKESDQEDEDVIFKGNIDIVQKDWLPESTTEHKQDFIDWVNHINNYGEVSTKYKKFNLYVQQSKQWIEEQGSDTDYKNAQDLAEYRQEELRRCAENTLYFLDKYVFYKEGDDKSGKIKYVSYPAHKVMAFLNDSGYSVAIAKGRQIAATTTLMACDVKDAVFKRNYFMKFITEDQDKAEEIFEDKLKYVFSELPWWMRPDVANERDNLFRLGYKEQKGDRKGVNSTIRVTPPKRTAIAGGAPQKVKIDEAGNIGILGAMLSNQRPTMLKFNPVTKKLEMKRQLWWWGTGGELEKGGKSFETEFMSLLSNWNSGNYSDCTIPIFLNWKFRPGAQQSDYDREKNVAYSKKDETERKKAVTEFHQSWPETLSDVFKSSAKTIIDEDLIRAHKKRISEANAKHGRLCKYGWLEPIYDTNVPMDEFSDVPYKIIGANFVPAEGSADPRVTTIIFMDPVPHWKNRYYQGTDPISTDTGTSNMASAIWDKQFKTISALVDFRVRDVRTVFLQTLLLGIYYGTDESKKTTMELLESNIGQAYTQYKIGKGFAKEMVVNHELPDYLQNRSAINEGIGIDNKGLRNDSIISRTHELFSAYGDRIWIMRIYDQIETFTCTLTATGKAMWGPQNKKYFKDDTLFACVYAYICAELCFPEQLPQNTEQTQRKTKIVYELRHDANWNLVRVPVRKFV